MINNNILKESLNITKRNQRQKNQKEFNTAINYRRPNKKSTNLIAKLNKNKNLKKNEEGNRKTFRHKSKKYFFDKAQNNFFKSMKREKSADHLKKKLSLRQKIQLFFNEYGNYDSNYIHHNFNKTGKLNNKLINNKNYNTLILFKKNKGESLIEKKRKSYFSPEKLDQKNKNNFYKRLLNLQTVSGSKLNNNNINTDILLYNHKENLNINNNYENNYNNLINTKNKTSKKIANKNNKSKNSKKKKYLNNTNLIKKIAFTPQKNNFKIKFEKDKEKEKDKGKENKNINNNILTKSTNDKPNSNEKIQVNKNEENNNNINNYDKINVRKIDSLTNYNTNNSININLILENKIYKGEEMCLTDENQMLNKNRNENNVNNIKVCKSNKNEESKKIKNFKRNKSCKKPLEIRETSRDSISLKKIRYKDKTKTPNKESLFNLKNFQNLLISNIYNNSNINNANSETFHLYNILYGNNGKLVEKVLKTRNNWEKIDTQNPQCANLIWTPLSCQINYTMHSTSENTQFVNHFEFHRELTNKANTFINLFRYCEFNDIDLFSFYPLTIILTSNLDYLQTQIEGFKRCYNNLPKFLYDINNTNNNINTNNNTDNNNNLSEEKTNNMSNNDIIQDKYYINYFNVNLSKKIGTRQKIQIPKTFYIGKNLWMLKRTNLNRGREMKILSNIDDIVTEINSMFDSNKKQKPNNLIIQKYLESPLLYNGRKFDIRIWVLFTYLGKDNNYNVYVFKEGHLKACSDEFNINSDNLFIHLTNYSVQKHNINFSKSEIGNEISFKMFQDELNRQKSGKNFKKDIFPEIIKIIWITAKAGKNKINIMDRKNCFEIFGYDFILDTNYNPFLLEINTNPGLEESSPLIKMLVPRMIDDALRLTVDKSFESGKNSKEGDKSKSKFSVEGYSDEENMWLKIKKI